MTYRPLAKEPKNILVIRLGGIGEIIAITPALRVIRKRFPQAKVTLLAQYSSYEIIRGAGLVDEIIRADEVFAADSLLSMLSFQFIQELAKLIKGVRAMQYDIFLNFQHLYYWRSVLKPMLIGLLCGARRRIGFNSYNRGFFLTDKVTDLRMEPRHLIYRNREFLKPLGIEIDDFSAVISVSDEDRIFADRLLNTLAISKGHILIGVNAGSSRFETRWSKDRFCALLDKVLKNYKAKVILVGSKEEKELCDEISNTIDGGCINIAGSTTIGQLTAVMGKLALFISNDTGPLHIAHSLGIPTVGIFRPREYPIWGSYEDKDRFVAVYKDIWCSSCYKYISTNHICLNSITVDDVYKGVEQLLKNV